MKHETFKTKQKLGPRAIVHSRAFPLNFGVAERPENVRLGPSSLNVSWNSEFVPI